jgi:hypothetical protein
MKLQRSGGYVYNYANDMLVAKPIVMPTATLHMATPMASL